MSPQEDDLHEQIVRLEARIEELAAVTASCRKLILMSKLAVAAGGIGIVAIVFSVIAFDAITMMGAIAALLGGTVLFGSNKSTLQQSMAALSAAERERARLIGQIELRTVEEQAAAQPLRQLP